MGLVFQTLNWSHKSCLPLTKWQKIYKVYSDPLTHSALQIKTDTCVNSVYTDKTTHLDLHRFHFDFTQKPLFEAVDMSKFKDGRVHFRNSVIKGLNQLSIVNMSDNILRHKSISLRWYINCSLSLSCWRAVVKTHARTHTHTTFQSIFFIYFDNNDVNKCYYLIW